jgi:hypothetical protein
LKFANLPFVEAWVPVKDSEAIVKEIDGFRWSTDENKLCNELGESFFEAKGNNAAYARILITFLGKSLKQKNSANKQLQKIQKVDDTNQIQQLIKSELEYSKVKKFADEVDAYYKDCLVKNIDFTDLRTNLTEEVMSDFYNQFKKDFPTVHYTFAAIAHSRSFKEADKKQPSMEEESPGMHTKQCHILFLWFASIRTKSGFLLKHWSIIEPLGHYYKGHQQPSSKSMSGSFTSTVTTALNALDTIYNENIHEFNYVFLTTMVEKRFR